MSDAFKWGDFVHDIGTIMKDPVVDNKSDHESLGHDGTLHQIFKKHLQYFTEINDQDFPSPIRLLEIERERISMLKSLKSVDTDAILKSIKQKAQKTTQSPYLLFCVILFLRKLLLPFGCFGSSCVNEGNTEVGTAGPVLPEVGEQYNGTSGYEILRAVAKQQLDSTVSLADVHNLRAASKYINEDIMVANEHRKAKALSDLRNSCPSEFREKALRELFQESPRIPSWPRGDVVTEYYKKEVSVFFNNTNKDQVDQCLESVALLCAYGAVVNSKSRLNLKLSAVSNNDLFKRISMRKLFLYCPVRLIGSNDAFDQIGSAEFNGISELVRSAEFIYARNTQTNTINFPNVIDLHFIQRLESEHLATLLSSKFNSTKLKYLKWDAGNLVYRVKPAVATITTILDQCHNLQYLEMSNLLNDCYAQILSSFPVGLKHLAIKELALDNASSNALDAYLARSSNLESLTISYIRYIQTFPFLPRQLKKLILIPLGYELRGYIMPNLESLTELRELVSGYSLNYMSFYQRIPRSVTDLHLRVSSDGSKILHDIIGQLKTLTIECDIWVPGIHHWIELFQDSSVKTAGFRHCWTPDGSSPKGILNIETLLLEGNKFYDPGRPLISLLSSKPRLPYLKHVSMKTQNDFMEAVLINSTVIISKSSLL